MAKRQRACRARARQKRDTSVTESATKARQVRYQEEEEEEEDLDTPNGVSSASGDAGQTKRAKSEYTREFEAWWLHCPLKKGKRKAAAEFRRAKGRGVTIEALTSAMDRYAESVRGKDPEHIIYPERWLSKGRYEDEDGPQSPGFDFAGMREE